MDKIKRIHSIPRDKRENIGMSTGLFDANKEEIITGNSYRIGEYIGKVFWNVHADAFGLFMGCWYSGQNENDPRCYGKFIKIPKDNGMRMEIHKI